MTPSDIEILIHCHVTPSVHPRFDALAVKESFANFVDLGLIEPFAGSYKTTPRGEAFVNTLCQMPMPVQAWVHPLTGKIIDW